MFKNGELEKVYKLKISNLIGMFSEKFTVEIKPLLENTSLKIGKRNKAVVILQKDKGWFD